jgi:GT2 family glycosyltransferase
MFSQTVNIGITSYNRVASTIRCIKSVKRFTRHPHILTVVDNGSSDGSRETLLELKAIGLIDNLFLFKKNMGVSCACNYAWAAEDTPYYVKLDNDNVILAEGWLQNLVNTISAVKDMAILAYNVYGHNLDRIAGPHDTLFYPAPFCGGSCAIIRRDIHERLGFWNEDYGLYGEEDGDFGERVRLAGLFSAYLDAKGVVAHLHEGFNSGDSDAMKLRENRRKNLETYYFNRFLFEKGIRPLFVGRKYVPQEENGFISFTEDPTYAEAMKELAPAKALADNMFKDIIDSYIRGELD